MPKDSEELVEPTVKDIIAYLSQFPPDSPFRIKDADTGWTIPLINASQDEEGTVWFEGDYCDMENP